MKITLKNRHEWRLIETMAYGHEKWISNYYLSDGDHVRLYIQEDKRVFELYCFSGIPASNIFIDSVDFSVFQHDPNKVDDLDFSESFHIQCIKIADYMCRKLCKYDEKKTSTSG
jgi:hypothetical protein